MVPALRDFQAVAHDDKIRSLRVLRNDARISGADGFALDPRASLGTAKGDDKIVAKTVFTPRADS